MSDFCLSDKAEPHCSYCIDKSYHEYYVKEFIKRLKEALDLRRQRINEGNINECMTAHLHTFVNHFETELDKLAGEKLI